MKTIIILTTIILSACAAPQQSGPVDNSGLELGIRLLEMSRPRPAPMPFGTTCRTYWHLGYARTVCD